MFNILFSILQATKVHCDTSRDITDILPTNWICFMARLLNDSSLKSKDKRLSLKPQKEPYWRVISEGIHLGYYRCKKGAGKWHARAQENTNKKYHKKTLGDADDFSDADETKIFNFAQAQGLAQKFAAEVNRHDDLESKKYTVQTAIKDYLQDFRANGKKSLYSTEAQINAHILPVFGNKLVSELTFRQLNAWKNKLAISDKRLRSSTKFGEDQQYASDQSSDPEYQRKRRATANRIVTILKAILNHAYNTNHIQSNDAWKKVKPFKHVSEAKIRFLNEQEIIRLLNACELDFRSLVRGALLTGARYGELTNLKVADFNTDNNSILIAQTKSGKARYIPLNDEGLLFFKQLTIGRDTKEYIFCRTDGKKWMKNYQVRPLEAACHKAKIPPINFHILRHTYGSSLAMRGVPLQVIATVLGHADTRITHKHYAHLMPSYVADVIKQHLPSFGKTEPDNVLPLAKTRKINV